MKRTVTVALLLTLVMVLGMVGCGSNTTNLSSNVLSKESVAIKEGESITISVKTLPETATEAVVWTSSDDGVATVNNGEITGIKTGSAKIIASGEVSGINAICEVTVEAPPAYDQLSSEEKQFVDAFLKYGVPNFVQPKTIEIKNVHYNKHDTMGVYWEVQMNVANGFGGMSGNIYLLLEKAFDGEHFLRNGQEPAKWSSHYNIALINRAIQESLS